MLINCVVYADGQKLQDIDITDIARWRGKPGQFVWVALRDPSEDELTQMQLLFDLHGLPVEDAQLGSWLDRGLNRVPPL